MTNIYVLVPLEWSYTRQLVLGVREYSRRKADWRVVWAGGVNVRGVETLERRNAGLVAMVRTEGTMRAVKALGIPCVNVSGRLRESGVPRVMPDQRAIGRMGALHLYERGYRRFLFVGDPAEKYSREREEGFCEALHPTGATWRRVSLADLRSPSCLRGIRTPVGIMMYLDDVGPDVISACRAAGWEIPREAAVVGVNNDEVFCDLADVPLSSVDPDAARVGFEAAALLDRILRGGRRPQRSVLVPPKGVVVRASSDCFALEDRDLARAAQYVRDHACDPMTVREILPHIGISRRTLEQRFRRQFGRTLHEEVRRVQLEQAKRLLVETDLTIREVGRRSGFLYANRFSMLFRSATGMPPGAYRRKRRMAAK